MACARFDRGDVEKRRRGTIDATKGEEGKGRKWRYIEAVDKSITRGETKGSRFNAKWRLLVRLSD